MNFLNFLVFLLLVHCFHCSLLQETLTKSAKKTEENDGVDVEIVSDKEDNKDDHEVTDNTKEDHTNATIELQTIYRPKECKNITKSGKVAVLHYTGWVDGHKFDSTIDPMKRYTPFEFLLGTGAVIKGFEHGLKDMCKGEQRKMIIPPVLGYGSTGAGVIPGNATITYEVQLLDVREPPPQADVFSAMDADGDKKLTRDEVADYMKKQAQMYYGAPTNDEYWNNYHRQMVENIFEQEDMDEDGHISHEEFSGPKLHHEEL